MSAVRVCPTTDQLQRMLLGQLSDVELLTVGPHLDGCPACLFALHVIEASDPFIQAMQAIGNPSSTAADPLVRDLLPRLRALNTEANDLLSLSNLPLTADDSSSTTSTRRRLKISLEIVEGPNRGRSFSFDQHDTFIVGRAIQAHFRLPEKDRYFSRLHLMIEVNPPYCRLLDLHSRNGTFVNGIRTNTADLKDGDQIRGGKTLIRVALAEVDEPGSVELASAMKAEPVPRPPRPAIAAVPRALLPQTSGQTDDQCAACEAVFDRSKAAPSRYGLCTDCRDKAERHEQLVAGYLIVEELGRGGMGVVYLAVRDSDGLPVALKTVKPAVSGNRREIDRFLREASILRELDHPHIVGCSDLGDVNGKLLYFAMDYVRGIDASRLLRRDGPLTLGRAGRMVDQLLAALEYAHAAGIVHRDIKPANLLVADGSHEQVRLADFGLARVYQSSRLSGLTMTGQIGGTLTFMAPEQISDFRNAPPSVDQFAAAATLYYLLTREYVHESHADQRKALLYILEGRTVPLGDRRADVPEELETIIHTALSREPKNRFRDVAEFRQRLQQCLADHEQSS